MWKIPFSFSRDGDVMQNGRSLDKYACLDHVCSRLVLLLYLVFFELASHIAQVVLDLLMFLPLPPRW